MRTSAAPVVAARKVPAGRGWQWIVDAWALTAGYRVLFVGLSVAVLVLAGAAGMVPLIGPFTVRHVLLLVGTLLVAAVLLAALNLPIARPTGVVTPTLGTGFYQIGDPTTGLAIGQHAPELTGISDGQTVALTDLDGKPLRLADMKARP